MTNTESPDAEREQKPAASAPRKKTEKPAEATQKPVEREQTRYVTGKGDTDRVVFSALVPADQTHRRASLSVHRLQYRLSELGYSHALVDKQGSYGELTRQSVSDWQKDQGEDVTGVITPHQALKLFEGDSNVTLEIDVPYAE